MGKNEISITFTGSGVTIGLMLACYELLTVDDLLYAGSALDLWERLYERLSMRAKDVEHELKNMERTVHYSIEVLARVEEKVHKATQEYLAKDIDGGST